MEPNSPPIMPSRPSIPTRPSLLARLRAGDDLEGWQEFYRVYAGLLRSFALRSGLTESEAEEVVQETAIGVARNLPGFRYDPASCSFKSWMLNLAQWRIADAWRRRGPQPTGSASAPPGPIPGNAAPAETDPSSGTPFIERLPDPHPPDFGAEWDAEWERHLRQAALDRIRESVDPRQYQIFDLYVLKDQPAREVAARLGIRTALVYLAKQRVSSRLRKEMRKLAEASARPGPGPKSPSLSSSTEPSDPG